MDYQSNAFLSNPHAHFKILRERSPVYFEPQLKAWLLTSHASILAAMKAKEVSSQIRNYGANLTEDQRIELAPLLSAFGMRMQWTEQSDHKKIRFQWAHVFSEGSVQRIAPLLSELIQRRMDLLETCGRIDVMHEFRNFPGEALAAYLGVTWEDVIRFKPWIDQIVEFIQHPNYEIGKLASRAIVSWSEDFTRIVDIKRSGISSDEIATEPERQIARTQGADDDVIAAAIKAGVANSEEFFATFLSFFCGINEPMIASIGSTMLALLKRPDQYQAVVDDLGLAERAAHESLRYEAPFQAMRRVAADDWHFGASQIKKGDTIFLVLAAGNRDPEYFERPDEFDLSRENTFHVAFGFGRHRCIAAALALLELTEIIRAFAYRFPKLRLVDSEHNWTGALNYRKIDHLLVAKA